jgi:hypothetical protein
MSKTLLIVFGTTVIVSLVLGMVLPFSWPLALRRLRDYEEERDRARIAAIRAGPTRPTGGTDPRRETEAR